MDHIIDIVNFNTLEYVFECLSKFNAGVEKVILRAYGGNISKGIEVARILQQKEVGITLHKNTVESISIGGIDVPFIEIPLKASKTRLDKNGTNDTAKLVQDFSNIDFINYSTYHLLFDWHLKKSGNLRILTRGQMTRDKRRGPVPLLDIEDNKGIRKYKTFRVEGLDKKEGIKEDEVTNALYRAGLLLPGKWKEIGNRLSKYDDIILGLDTNVLFRCAVSRHLLPIVSLVEPKEFVHTPNWILLVVPSTVMYELEEAANIRDFRGLLLHKGRMGFRALQEIMDLSENIDIPGISLLIHGETNPVLDMKNTLFGIRKDILRFTWDLKKRDEPFKPPIKSSSGDMSIRFQFKKFLNQIDFHKGTFFLTADKSNSVLAQAEGLCPIYIPYPKFSSTQLQHFPLVSDTKKVDERVKQFTLNVPLGNIIYEMAVSFGEIIISCDGQSPSIECDRRGADIGHWVHKQLRISKEDLTPLLKNYSGRFNLERAADLNKKIIERFENVEWLTEMGGAFKSDQSD
jgi:DNA-binding protein